MQAPGLGCDHGGQPNNALVPSAARAGCMADRLSVNLPTTPSRTPTPRPNAARPAASLPRGGRGCSTAPHPLGGVTLSAEADTWFE